MDMNKFMDILESRSDISEQDAKTLKEGIMSGENVPEEVKKKYGFKWAYVPEKYNIIIGLKEDSNDFENDKWEVVHFEKKSTAAVTAKAGMEKEFEGMNEGIDFSTNVEISKSGDMNFIKLLGVIKDLLENKSIEVLHTTAAKLKSSK